jgi:hypothetical protein
MDALNILLSRNHKEQDWSVEIDGHRHEHITTKTLDDLVECALVATEQLFLESEAATHNDEAGSDAEPC